MRTGIRHEFAVMATVLALSAAVAMSFPYGAVRFKAAGADGRREAGAAFVVLTEAQERAALAAAKAAWQGDSGVRRMHADLSVGELPEDVVRPVLGVRERPTFELKPADYSAGAFLPSAAAKSPVRIAPEASAADKPSAFSREELLKID